MIRKVLWLNSAALIYLFMLGLGGNARADQGDQLPAKELVQYVHDAKRRGVTDAKIKKQAVEVGWTAAAVDQAIAYEKTGKPPVASTLAATANPEPRNAVPSTQPAPATESAKLPATPEKVSSTPAGIPKISQSSDDYLIGAGDTLQVSVWKEPEASVPTVVVRPDGRITMPLVKEVDVAGLTPRQAEAAITEKLGKFITDPNVTVVVAIINSKKIYMIGAVRKEGTLAYTYGMTVMQALSEAGGLNDYAKRKKIYILRTENGREYRLDFNYEEVVRGENMGQNRVLLPGDTVVIPQ